MLLTRIIATQFTDWLHAGHYDVHAVLVNSPHKEPQYLDEKLGMHPAAFALCFGIVSGLSLPLGAFLGIQLSPVSSKVTSCMMAFGAGALLFAVTVELYGHALHELSNQRLGMLEMFVTVFGALVGASLYLVLNSCLEDYLLQNPAEEEKGDIERAEESEPLVPETKAEEEKEEEEDDSPPPVRRTSKSEPNLSKVPAQLNLPQKPLSARTQSKIGPQVVNEGRGRCKVMHWATQKNSQEARHAKQVASALFLGLLVDGVPEGILIGFLAAEGHLGPVFILSLFIANFPEAFSSSSMLIEAQMSQWKIIGLWTSLCVLVGSLGGVSCFGLLWAFPDYRNTHGTAALPVPVLVMLALIEGLTGGAMIACISSVMLPEAFEKGGKTRPFYTMSGFQCAAGFLMAVSMKALFG